MASEQWIVPVEQNTVMFYDHPIIATRLGDGRICIILRWICEGLQLDANAQLRRIRRTEAILEELVNVQVITEGGTQVMPALTLRALPFWLAGINTSQVSENLRPTILAYQREVVEVLYHHFAEQRTALKQAQALTTSEPLKPTRPERDAPRNEWISYHEQMAVWMRWQAEVDQWRDEVEQWRGNIEGRMESVEEVSRLFPEILERLGPETLSPEHQRMVQTYVNRLHDLTGRTHAAIYDELRTAFRVPRYSEIHESSWTEVAAWFQVRLGRAPRRPEK